MIITYTNNGIYGYGTYNNFRFTDAFPQPPITAATSSFVKTWDSIAKASIKTWDGIANASIKKWNGIT